MASFAGAIVAIMLFLFGIMIGAKIGDTLGGECVTKRDYWVANAKVLGVGVVVSALVSFTGFMLLAGIPIGAMAGGIAGIKMAFGESVGPWKVHDRMLRVNKDQLRRSESKQAEQVRRARKEGGPEPELMSVASTKPMGERPKNKRASKGKKG